MKKIIFAFGAIALLAAGCNTAKPYSNNNSADSQSKVAGKETSNTEIHKPSPTTAVNVEVNNPNDAIKLLQSNSSEEQSLTTGSDESDISSTDSSSLNSFTEVSNGF